MGQLPEPLKPGDIIRVVAPSGAFDPAGFEQGLCHIRSCGFEVCYSTDIFERWHYLAGSDERRLKELVGALEENHTRALWLARGGYGITRILPKLQKYVSLLADKWLIGFSDGTALHSLWAQVGVASIHAANVTTLTAWSPESREELCAILLGNGRPKPLLGRVTNCKGRVRGRLLGGNLSVLAAMVGTGYLPIFDNSILLLEDIGEKPYRLDRMLTQLLQTQILSRVVGFAVGQLTDCVANKQDVNEPSAVAVVIERLSALGVPIITDLPIGHETTARPVILGVDYWLDGNQGTLTQIV